MLQLVTQNDTTTTEDAVPPGDRGQDRRALRRRHPDRRRGRRPAGRRRRTALDTYGRTLGTAFQLVDDALDYSAEQEQLGKTVGDDFREGKITLPVLLAFERGTEAERGFWRRTLEERDQGPDDLAEAQRLIARHRALHDTVERARLYGDQALAALQCFPDGAERRALADIVEFCIARAR